MWETGNNSCTSQTWISIKITKSLEGTYVVAKCFQGNVYRLKNQENFRKRVLRHRDQLGVVTTSPERLRLKTPATPEIEEHPTARNSLVPDRDPSTLPNTIQESPEGACTAIPNVSREEIDTKMDEQRPKITNEKNPELGVTDPDRHKTLRTGRPPVIYGWDPFSIWN